MGQGLGPRGGQQLAEGRAAPRCSGGGWDLGRRRHAVPPLLLLLLLLGVLPLLLLLLLLLLLGQGALLCRRTPPQPQPRWLQLLPLLL